MKNDEMRMPKVGDRLMRVMSSTCFANSQTEPEPCIVIYICKPKHYYTVQFVASGIKESYKVPFVDEIKSFKEDYKRMFKKNARGVYVYESGMLYPSITECAKDIGVKPYVVSRHIHGDISNVKGYHIYMLD